MENITAGETLTPSPCPEQNDAQGNITAKAKNVDNFAKKLPAAHLTILQRSEMFCKKIARKCIDNGDFSTLKTLAPWTFIYASVVPTISGLLRAKRSASALRMRRMQGLRPSPPEAQAESECASMRAGAWTWPSVQDSNSLGVIF
jgi:hypothetical protein